MRTFITFLGSYGLAAVLLLLLLVLTLAGTLEQQRSTIYDVQTRYFESLGVVHYWAGKYPTPLPGGLLLMGLLAINLLIGGLVRMRKGVSTLGVFVVHLGILFILVGSGMEALFSTKGATMLWEPVATDTQDQASRFTSYEAWEVAIVRHDADGGTTEFIVPHGEFEDVEGGDTLRAKHPDLPFDLVLLDYARNSRVRAATPEEKEGTVGGLVLEALEPVSAEQRRKSGRGNVAGLRAQAVERASGRAHEGLVWGGRSSLFRFATGDQRWSIDLRKRSWPLPFDIRLTKFVHEYHPGTMMPRRYSSYVVVNEGSGEDRVEREVHITMNEPLRHGLYTLYQSSWGPEMGAPDRRLFSVLAVVKMPSAKYDLVPWIGCGIVFLGLVIHFSLKLGRYLKSEARKRAYAREKAAVGSSA